MKSTWLSRQYHIASNSTQCLTSGITTTAVLLLVSIFGLGLYYPVQDEPPDCQPHDTFQNIIVCTGADFYRGGDLNKGALTERVQKKLFSSGQRSLRGQSDFIVTTALGPNGKGTGGGKYWHIDQRNYQPRPLRGRIWVGSNYFQNADRSKSEHAEALRTLAEEVGHHWLVPNPAWVGASRVATQKQVMKSFYEGESIPDLPLIARNESHWSAYWDGDWDHMDGVDWTDTEQQQGDYRRWHAYKRDETELVFVSMLPFWNKVPKLKSRTVPNYFSVDNAFGHDLSMTGYNDLDLHIMGVISADETYPSRQRNIPEAGYHDEKFRYMIPKITSPEEYMTGLVLSFTRAKSIYFGIYKDPWTLKVSQTLDEYSSSEIDMKKDTFSPFLENKNSLLLRVVKDEEENQDTFCFQARVAGSDTPSSTKVVDIDESCSSSNPTGGATRDFSQWQTVGVYRTSGGIHPEYVGFGSKTWSGRMLRSSFRNLYVSSSPQLGYTYYTQERPREVNTWYDLSTNQDWAGSFGDATRFYNPGCADTVRTTDIESEPEDQCPRLILKEDGWIQLILPSYSDGFNHWVTSDNTEANAPNVLTKPPSGEFALGTELRLDNVLFEPDAGGVAEGKDMWGQVHYREVSEFKTQIPDWKRARPEDNEFRASFVVVAKQQADISSDFVRNLDMVRRAFEDFFKKATARRPTSAPASGTHSQGRKINTDLPSIWQ